MTVKIPPLRERPEDISTLISYFLTHYCSRNDREIAASPGSHSILEEHTCQAMFENWQRKLNVGPVSGPERIIPPEHISGTYCRRDFMMELQMVVRRESRAYYEDYERRVLTEP